MKNNILDQNNLKAEILALMDEVSIALKSVTDIDEFLDRTDIFDNWENLLSEEDYPIFVMAILNNIRRDSIIDSIVNDILNKPVGNNSIFPSDLKHNKFRSHMGEHPFS